MKKVYSLMATALLLTSCSAGFVENRESRSLVYRGQTTWDMYENFGAPDFAVRVSPEETHFIYRREEVTRDWTRMYFDWCDMAIVTVNDRVVDWNFSGNQCTINVGDEELPPPDDNPRVNLVEEYQKGLPQPIYEDERVSVYDTDERETLF